MSLAKCAHTKINTTNPEQYAKIIKPALSKLTEFTTLIYVNTEKKITNIPFMITFVMFFPFKELVLLVSRKPGTILIMQIFIILSKVLLFCDFGQVIM